MLRSVSQLRGYGIAATDGDLGLVEDFYFDDHFWHIRYVVVDTRVWLPGRRVLIGPNAIGAVMPELRQLVAELSQEQVRNSPGIETDMPVSRQHEAQLTKYYGWPAYWAPVGLVGAPSGDASKMVQKPVETDAGAAESADPHLRSIKEVTGYEIEAPDGSIGHVEDFVVDDEHWIVRYFVIDTRNWLPGRKVLAWPQSIESVNWEKRKVTVGLDREAIKTSPAYDPNRPVRRDYELLLYQHYGEQGYWLNPEKGVTDG